MYHRDFSLRWLIFLAVVAVSLVYYFCDYTGKYQKANANTQPYTKVSHVLDIPIGIFHICRVFRYEHNTGEGVGNTEKRILVCSTRNSTTGGISSTVLEE